MKPGIRADGSPVREVSDFNQVWPEIARELDVSMDGLQVTLGQLQGIEHVSFASKVKQLAMEKDQLNNQLQIWARTRYVSYINAEYDPDPASRQKGRESWEKAVDFINLQAFSIRQKTLALDIEGQKFLALEKSLPKAKSNTETVRRFVQQHRIILEDDEDVSRAVETLKEAENEEHRLGNELEQSREKIHKILDIAVKSSEATLRAAAGIP